MSITSAIMIPNTQLGEAVSVAPATNGIGVPRATGGPVLNLDLMTIAERLRLEAAWSDGRNSRTLVMHGDFRVVLTVMKAGARLHKHHASGTVLIQVLSGCIRARLLDEVIEVRAGHALSLDPHLEHEVEAADDSALLITIAWPHGLGIVRKEPTKRLATLGMIADQIEAAAQVVSDAA